MLDASRAVNTVASLLDVKQRADFFAQNLVDQERLRKQHANQRARKMLSLVEARNRKQQLSFGPDDIAVPAFTGRKVLRRRAHRGDRPVHRLALLLQRLGDEGRRALPSSRIPPRARPRATSTTMRRSSWRS